MKKLIIGLVMLAAMIGPFSMMTAKADETQATMKSLIIYYSWSGNTELVSKTLAEIIKADVIKLEDVAKPSKEEAFSSGKDAAQQGKSWPIKSVKTDLTGYERIFIGSPVWFGMPAPAFNAFIEQVDFKGKSVVVFVTLGGGSPDTAIKAMTEKVTAKGGKVVSSFHVRTKNVTKDDMVKKAKEIASQYQ